MTAPRFVAPAGEFVGRRDGEVVRATGIRYARAARWAVPQPEPPAETVVDATAWSPACPQPPDPVGAKLIGAGMLGDLPFDEHCQRLSITVPGDLAPDERLPVMVWIHGGAYVTGAGDAPIHDPAALVREHRVVAVNVTYRLGLFGYLGDGVDRPANLGLLDQREALRWVQANIAAFGGDPDDVTVYGESAGGDAIAHLMIAEGTTGLFRRAILQSPPLGIATGRAAMTRALARVAARIPADATVEQVLAAHDTVTRAALRFGPARAAMPFGVQYGQYPLPAEEDAPAAWAAVAPGFEVLAGRNAREGALFLPGLDRLLAAPTIGPLLASGYIPVVTRRVYGRGVERFARHLAANGGAVHAYRLRFGRRTNPYADAHTTDIALLFPCPAVWDGSPLLAGLRADELDRLGRALRTVWAGFARTGTVPVPGVDGLIGIAAVDGSDGRRQRLSVRRSSRTW
ncbi:MAG: carboxylesterase family protein [Jatrophihabitans sp.]|uniref:carboxylesterase family protein n=1 Tax=Jatrophihabitans sp. TaxID=1932789 RepID=UPI003F7F25F9